MPQTDIRRFAPRAADESRVPPRAGVDDARVARLLQERKISPAQAESLRGLLARGVRDPATENDVPKSVVRLWYKHAACDDRRWPALADAVALSLAGTRSNAVAKQLADTADDREWDGLRSALDGYMQSWTAVTRQRCIVAALLWRWMHSAGALDVEASFDEAPAAVTVEQVARNPSLLVDVLNHFASEHKLRGVRACQAVDAVALEHGWWAKGDAKRSRAFVVDFLWKRLREHEYIEESTVEDELVVDGVDVDVAIGHATSEAGGRVCRLGEGRRAVLTFRSVLQTTREVFGRVAKMLAEPDQGTEADEAAAPHWNLQALRHPVSEVIARLNAEQLALVTRVAAGQRVTACCSKPGTGKTYSASALASLVRTVCCLAPTHKALARMQEQIEHPNAHFLTVQSFVLQEAHACLAADLVLVDECSMCTMFHMAAILGAYAPSRARLVLMGDDNQLPCIGRGAPFRDLVRFFGDALNQRLHRCMRTSSSGIAAAADAILAGRVPAAAEDVALLQCADPLAELAKELRFDAREQMIASERRHVRLLNDMAQTRLQRSGASLSSPGPQRCYVGDLVRITKSCDAYKNGEEGTLRSVQLAQRRRAGEVLVRRKLVEVPEGAVEPAYACTVHRVQGSEYDVVAVVLFADMAPMMRTRELVYTAATRAKTRLLFVGALHLLKHLFPIERDTLVQAFPGDVCSCRGP